MNSKRMKAQLAKVDRLKSYPLDEALAPGKIAGPRYNSTTMSMIDR